MSKTKENMQNRIEELNTLIAEKENSLKSAPPGSLRISSSPKRTQYYHIMDKGDNCGKYISKSNQGLAFLLAQKQYDQEVIDMSQKEIDVLSTTISLIPEKAAEDIYNTMSEHRKALITPICLTDEQFVEQWMAIPYVKKPISDGLPEFYTNLGERVRSKSEVIYANMLYGLGVPYKYECPLVLDYNNIIYPDFTALSVSKRKVFYLEHLGMMDDPEYLEHALSKLNMYQRNGYFLGEDLIITYETKQNPLNTRMLERILIHYLL